jgi:hypothetical protein
LQAASLRERCSINFHTHVGKFAEVTIECRDGDVTGGARVFLVILYEKPNDNEYVPF